MRAVIALTVLTLLTACNPESECARYGDGELFTVTLTEDGVVGELDSRPVDRARRMLKNELWTDWRFAARLFTPVLLEDGTTERRDLRLFSMRAPFSRDLPESFQPGVVPDGWEQGLENFTTADTYQPWPTGPLPSGDEYDLYLEVLNPDDGNVRCAVGDADLTIVP